MSDLPKMKCDVCEGSGLDLEDHEHGEFEQLGCTYCRGTGFVSMQVVKNIIDLISYNGFRLVEVSDE